MSQNIVELTIALLVAVLLIVLWQYRARRGRQLSNDRLRPSQAKRLRARFDRNTLPDERVTNVLKTVRSDPSAKDLLEVVRKLAADNRMWPEIMAAINPTNDAVVGRSLTALRGPHQFIPHVALNVLEDGCLVALAKNPRASANDAMNAALRSADLVVRAGD